jgi:hypothetical protein
MSATPEEEKFFEDEKSAQAAEIEETESAEEESAEPSEASPAEEPEGEEPAAEPTEGAAEPRHVPIGELHAERERRKELQAKISQLEGTFSKVMERLNAGQPQQQYAQQPAPQIPAYDQDPVGHIKAKLDYLEMAAGTHNQVLTQQQAIHQFTTALAGLENQFRSATPDYDDAVAFAKHSREMELHALGYDPAQCVEILRQEIVGTSAAAMQRGQNPAEVFYAYAKVRGYGAGNGSTVKPSQAPTSATQKLATVAKAQSAAKGLPRGGSAPPSAVTLESLAAMDDDEFDKNFDKFWRKS